MMEIVTLMAVSFLSSLGVVVGIMFMVNVIFKINNL